MKRLLIILSVAFNIAVLGTLAYGTYFAAPVASKGPDLGAVYEELNLTAAQKPALAQMRLETRSKLIAARERVKQAWLETMEIHGRPQLNEAAIGATEEKLLRAQDEYYKVAFRAWTERANLLTPEQRAKLFRTTAEQVRSGDFFRRTPPERPATKPGGASSTR